MSRKVRTTLDDENGESRTEDPVRQNSFLFHLLKGSCAISAFKCQAGHLPRLDTEDYCYSIELDDRKCSLIYRGESELILPARTSEQISIAKCKLHFEVF